MKSPTRRLRRLSATSPFTRTRPRSASYRNRDLREHSRQRLGVAVLAQRHDHAVAGLEDTNERAVVSGVVGENAVDLTLDHDRFAFVEAAEQINVDLEQLFASLDRSPQGLLVERNTGGDAPIAEVIAEQREALVEIPALAHALQEHPRQFGLRVVEWRGHIAIVSWETVHGQFANHRPT